MILRLEWYKNHRLLSRVTYSTLFPSQLWPLFYLESGTHGNFYFILMLGYLYEKVKLVERGKQI